MKLSKMQDSLAKVFRTKIGYLFFLITFGLLLDSKFVIPHFPYGQIAADILIVVLFIRWYKRSTKKVKEMLVYTLIIAVIGECFFSLVLKMYTYRLHMVPIYVFVGHSMLYLTVYYFCKARAVKENRKILEYVFIGIILVYCTSFLIFRNDYFGFILSVITLVILAFNSRERLFYLTMYLCIAYLEIIGTWYECWYWPAYGFNIESQFMQSSNPPTGICFFYFGLDLGCLILYRFRHFIAWKKMKRIRRMRLAKF